jgi:hypothetical protein
MDSGRAISVLSNCKLENALGSEMRALLQAWVVIGIEVVEAHDVVPIRQRLARAT